MQERWAVMDNAGEWARDHAGSALTFFQESTANAHRDALNQLHVETEWTTEIFTLEDALEEANRSPFATEGGL